MAELAGLIIFIVLVISIGIIIYAFNRGYKTGAKDAIYHFLNYETGYFEKLENEISSYKEMLRGTEEFYESQKKKNNELNSITEEEINNEYNDDKKT